LSEFSKFFQDKIQDEEVFHSFSQILSKTRKFAKQEVKEALAELEGKINASVNGDNEENKENVENGEVKKLPVTRGRGRGRGGSQRGKARGGKKATPAKKKVS
jgi:hypothetical protein